MTSPSMTLGANGNIRASATLAAGASDTSGDIDLRTKLEGQLHIRNTPGSAIATTRGLRVQVFRFYGATPTLADTPMVEVMLPSQALGTPESVEVFVPTGRYKVKVTNLDTTNAVTVEISMDTVDGLTDL